MLRLIPGESSSCINFCHIPSCSCSVRSDAGFHDRVVIQELLKEVARNQVLEASHKSFKGSLKTLWNLYNEDYNFFQTFFLIVVVLTEVDQLTRDAQHALRRTMEKYMATCRIILCCNSTSKVIPAIRSRCLGVRVAAPKIEEVCR